MFLKTYVQKILDADFYLDRTTSLWQREFQKFRAIKPQNVNWWNLITLVLI